MNYIKEIKKRIGLLFTLSFYLCLNHAFSQSQTNSPYSRFGLGDINAPALPQNFALGGGGFALQSKSFFNINNPASYSTFNLQSIDSSLIVFEAGVNSLTRQMQSATQKNLYSTASLGYVTFGLPLSKIRGLGMGFGFMPYSTTGYTVLKQASITDVGGVKYKFIGEGGIHKAFWGLGYQSSGFSFGGNVSYMFGHIIKEKRVLFDNLTSALSTKVVNQIDIGDFAFDLGAQYKTNFGSWKLGLGAVYGLETELQSKRQFLTTTYFQNKDIDTISIINETGSVVLPSTYGGGIVLENTKGWLFSIDYQATQWADFKSFGASDSLLNRNQFSFGFQRLPGAADSKEYWKTIQYRAGFRYAQSQLNFNGKQLEELGITFGGGFPLKFATVRRGRMIVYSSFLNAAVEMGQRGTSENNPIKENYINARIGITINDRWFDKPKYD